MQKVNFKNLTTTELNEFISKAAEELTKRANKSPRVITARKKVIEDAKSDLENLKDSTMCDGYEVGSYATVPEYHINRKKRVVTVLLKGYRSGRIYAKGIAKCDPRDTFNEHIGKAIALYRALSKKVPTKYLTVENPVEPEIGDIILTSYPEFENERIRVVKSMSEAMADDATMLRSPVVKNFTFIVDDSKSA